jgi:hypothetical protein
MPKTLEGPLIGRADPRPRESGVQLTTTFVDRRCRLSMITDVGIQRSRTPYERLWDGLLVLQDDPLSRMRVLVARLRT